MQFPNGISKVEREKHLRSNYNLIYSNKWTIISIPNMEKIKLINSLNPNDCK